MLPASIANKISKAISRCASAPQAPAVLLPAVLTGKQLALAVAYQSPSGPLPPLYSQSVREALLYGAGYSGGNAGGWTVGVHDQLAFTVAQRGIHQLIGGTIWKHAVGDCAAAYLYNRSDGGISAQSDEGCCGSDSQVTENSGYFHGTIAATIGLGDTNPKLAFASGNQWATDGSFLLNISKRLTGGNLTGASKQLQLTLANGVIYPVPWLNYLTVSPALPLSTAIGVMTSAAIPPTGNTEDRPILRSITVAPASINGSSILPAFSANQVVTVAGDFYTEQTVIQSAAANADGSQTITLQLRKANNRAIIFAGGIQGTYLSLAANLAFSGMRTAYYALGSLTGADLIYDVNVTGGMHPTLPMIGNMAATTDGGANSVFDLYPGAEIISNYDGGFGVRIEQNRVSWAPLDLVEIPHYPVWGGSGSVSLHMHDTPACGSYGTNGNVSIIGGKGMGGPQSSAYAAVNTNPWSYYAPAGGPMDAPDAWRAVGPFGGGLYLQGMPNRPLIFVQNPPPGAALPELMNVICLDFISGGNLFYNSKLQAWQVPQINAGAYMANGSPGQSGSFVSQDGKTIQVENGLIIGGLS